MPKDFDRPNVLDRVYKSKGWKANNTLIEIDTYFYSLKTNYKELQSFIANNQSYESFENRELDKEFFRLLSNFCNSMDNYYHQRKHWFEGKKQNIRYTREFYFIKALRNTIVHNRIPPIKTACPFTTKGIFVIRSIQRKAYLKYLENSLTGIRKEDYHIKDSFKKAITVLNQYNDDEIDISTECEKCYNELKRFNEILKDRYKNENAEALEEMHKIWDEIFEKAQGR